MASRDGGGPDHPSAEELRQLGAAIDRVAALHGLPVSSRDSAVVAALLSGLGPSGLEALARSPDFVLGKVADLVMRFADMDLKRQEARKATGPQGAEKDNEPGADKDKAARSPRERADKLAQNASNDQDASNKEAAERGG